MLFIIFGPILLRLNREGSAQTEDSLRMWPRAQGRSEGGQGNGSAILVVFMSLVVYSWFHKKLGM